MPDPPATFTRLIGQLLCGWLGLAATVAAQQRYEFGDPTPEEQLYVELINRARAAPPAEGARLATLTDPAVLTAYDYFNVNLGLMQTEFNAIEAQPPLAPNAKLTSTARGHSQWMLTNATQGHNETNPYNTPFTRMVAAGYNYASAAENVYATTTCVPFGHAGLEVDWDNTASGMLDGRGHRLNIHRSIYREIGVGIVNGSNNGVGPQLVTQDFGVLPASPSFATGVAYYDLNRNQFYDIGEGIAGLTVTVSDTAQYCTTAIGGGWVVPIATTAAARVVTFSGLNMNQTADLTVPAGKNAKADLKLTYAPPTITTIATAYPGATQTFAFTAAGGATGYQWNRSTTAAAAAEPCNQTTQVTTSTTGSYSLLSTTIKQEGTAAFHLQNTTGASQWIQLNPIYYALGTPTLSFQSRIRYATSSESFKVQVREEGSLVWQDVYSQSGTNNAGESLFKARTANLATMTGKAFRIRFLLNYEGGPYYTTSGEQVGWFIDAINFTQVNALSNTSSQLLAGTSGSFTLAAGTYLMSVAPVVSGRGFPASYQILTVSTSAPIPPAIVIQPASMTVPSASAANLTVAASGTAPVFQWYQGDSGDTSTPVPGATTAVLTTPALVATTRYWVCASNPAGSVWSDAATITVLTPFTSWAGQMETASHLAAGTLSNQPLADFDHDGRSNLLEYAFGTSPVVAGDPASRMPTAQPDADRWVMRYERDTTLTDLQFTPEISDGLSGWQTAGPAAPAGFSDAIITTGNNREVHEVSVPRSSSPCFLRLRVSQR